MNKIVIALGIILVALTSGCTVSVDAPGPVEVPSKVPSQVVARPYIVAVPSVQLSCAETGGVWCAAPNGLEDCWTPAACAGWATPAVAPEPADAGSDVLQEVNVDAGLCYVSFVYCTAIGLPYLVEVR